MSLDLEQLRVAAESWIDGDPDPTTQAELAALSYSKDASVLAERMTPLSFGTAGLRGPVGAGPGRMNLAVVVRTACGIARYVESLEHSHDRLVVIGFDARPTSRAFAEASAGVLLAAGLRVVAFPEATATPLVAYFGRELQAAVSIVVTASHNPRGDNGYKVYGSSGVQIVAPVDALIAEQIARAPAARDVPRRAVSFAGASPVDLELLDAARQSSYFAAISAALPASAEGRELRIVHSALHGVGTAPMLRSLADAGFRQVSVVAEQASPDGSFPTTPFPNPEEPGTLDLALAEAERVGAALLLVNDPDADRLAAAARLDGDLNVLDGNQVGALLADFLIPETAMTGSSALVLSSVVSSPLVGLLCAARGGRHERTHTGFKWLWSAALELERTGQGSFCFAYEEALGYSVFPAVRDKDGIAAGRALAELSARLSARGLSPFDRLFELYAEHGLWASAAQNLALSGAGVLSRVALALDALITDPDLAIGGERVVRKVDYRTGAELRPAWLGHAQLIELELASGARLFVRPSGTEPKLKLYGHVRSHVTLKRDFRAALAAARESAGALLQQLAGSLKL
jgi:phosphomannomutase